MVFSQVWLADGESGQHGWDPAGRQGLRTDCLFEDTREAASTLNSFLLKTCATNRFARTDYGYLFLNRDASAGRSWALWRLQHTTKTEWTTVSVLVLNRAVLNHLHWEACFYTLQGVLTKFDSRRLRFSPAITIFSFRIMLSTLIDKQGINRACRTFLDASCMDLPADALVTAEQSSCTECLSIIPAASPLGDHLGLSQKGNLERI